MTLVRYSGRPRTNRRLGTNHLEIVGIVQVAELPAPEDVAGSLLEEGGGVLPAKAKEGYISARLERFHHSPTHYVSVIELDIETVEGERLVDLGGLLNDSDGGDSGRLDVRGYDLDDLSGG